MKNYSEQEKQLLEQREQDTARQVSPNVTEQQLEQQAASRKDGKARLFFASLFAGIKHYAALIILIAFVGTVALVSNFVQINNGTSPLTQNSNLQKAEAEALECTDGSAIESEAALKQFLRDNTTYNNSFVASNYSAWTTDAGIAGLTDGKWNGTAQGFIYNDPKAHNGVADTMTYAVDACDTNGDWSTVNALIWYPNGGTPVWLNYFKFVMRTQGYTIYFHMFVENTDHTWYEPFDGWTEMSSSFTDYGYYVPLRQYCCVLMQIWSPYKEADYPGEKWVLVKSIEPSYDHNRVHHLTTDINLDLSSYSTKGNDEFTTTCYKR